MIKEKILILKSKAISYLDSDVVFTQGSDVLNKYSHHKFILYTLKKNLTQRWNWFCHSESIVCSAELIHNKHRATFHSLER